VRQDPIIQQLLNKGRAVTLEAKSPGSRGPKTKKIDPEQLLDAAQEIFASEGIKGTSIRAIAKAAGCDPALLYYHFENKETIFTALLSRKFPLLLGDLQRITDPSDTRHTSDRLWEVLQTYHKHLVDDSGFRATIRGELVRGAEGVRDMLTQRISPVLQALSGLIQQGIQRGHLRSDLHPTLTVFYFVRMEFEILDLIPIMGQRFSQIEPRKLLPTAERTWFELFWRGIAREPQAALPFLNQGATE
jgi:AcrR family transcriptional regulator